jgi:hypothetical protein
LKLGAIALINWFSGVSDRCFFDVFMPARYTKKKKEERRKKPFSMPTVTDNELKELKDLIKAGFSRIDSEITDLKINQARSSERLSGQIQALDAKLTGQINAMDEQLTGKINLVDEKNYRFGETFGCSGVS